MMSDEEVVHAVLEEEEAFFFKKGTPTSNLSQVESDTHTLSNSGTKNQKELFSIVKLLHQTLVVALGFGIDHQLSSTSSDLSNLIT